LRVKVRYFTTLQELARTREEELEVEEGFSLGRLIEIISSRYGQEALNYLHDKTMGEIDPSLKFLVNGVDLRRLQGFETRLKEGDIIAIIPAIGGG